MTNPSSIIQTLTDRNILRSKKVIDAFFNVPRKHFVPVELKHRAEENIPLPIGFGQTISQPETVAIMLEALQVENGDEVLDIGAGSGWVTGLLAHLVGPTGHVLGIERIPQLAQEAKQRLQHFRFSQVEVCVGDGSRGWVARAPFDRIHVAAAAARIPHVLLDQISLGGKILIPVGDPVQDLALITKTRDNGYTERRISGFQFVPLIPHTYG